MDATIRVLQQPHPLSRHPKRGDQHSYHSHLQAPGPDERRGSSPISGTTLAEGSARFCERAPARQETERVAGVAMREGARRDGDKLVIDPDICLNDLGIHMQLRHPDMLRLDAYADCPPSLVDKTDRKPFLGSSFEPWVRCLRRQRTASSRHRTREGFFFWAARGSREV